MERVTGGEASRRDAGGKGGAGEQGGTLAQTPRDVSNEPQGWTGGTFALSCEEGTLPGVQQRTKSTFSQPAASLEVRGRRFAARSELCVTVLLRFAGHRGISGLAKGSR